MKPIKIFILLSILFLGLVGVVLYQQHKREDKMLINYLTLDKIKNQLDKKYNYNIYSDPKTYSIESKKEYEKNINFPMEEPEYVIVKSNEFWKTGKKLTKNDMNEILRILNDSLNYEWGEIGTPYFDKYLIFYNAKNECVGLTDVSYDGQTYSKPSLIRMKWGLNNKTEELRKILEK